MDNEQKIKEMQEEIKRLQQINRENKRLKVMELKVELLDLFADHFRKALEEKSGGNSSEYNIRMISGSVDTLSYISIDIPVYGIENYYGKEISDTYKELMKWIKWK